MLINVLLFVEHFKRIKLQFFRENKNKPYLLHFKFVFNIIHLNIHRNNIEVTKPDYIIYIYIRSHYDI